MIPDREIIVASLQRHEVFSNLTREELDLVSNISEMRIYNVDEIVFSNNQEARFLFILVNGSIQLNIKGSEYKILKPADIFGEIGIINQSVRTGETRALERTQVIRIRGASLFAEEHIPAKTALKIVRGLAKKVSDYLIAREQVSTLELIKRGEGEFVEFKSTLRMNLRTGKKDAAMEKAVLKTIAAFLNSKGGTLLIGVNDSGEVLGMEQDKFDNNDRFALHLTNLIKSRVGSFYLKFVHLEVVSFDAKNVLRVDCNASTMPAYVIDGDNEHFYIRTGPSTTDMKISKVYDYISQRFSAIATYNKN